RVAQLPAVERQRNAAEILHLNELIDVVLVAVDCRRVIHDLADHDRTNLRSKVEAAEGWDEEFSEIHANTCLNHAEGLARWRLGKRHHGSTSGKIANRVRFRERRIPRQ